jgi:hypothetical protein
MVSHSTVEFRICVKKLEFLIRIEPEPASTLPGHHVFRTACPAGVRFSLNKLEIMEQMQCLLIVSQ